MMATEQVSAKLYYRACIFILFLITASVSFNGFYQKWHFHETGIPGDYPVASFERMVDGTAQRPFVYRQLIPAIANGLDRVTPARMKARLYQHQGSGRDAYLYSLVVSPTAGNEAYFFRYFMVYLLTFLFAWLCVYATYMVCLALNVPAPSAVFAPVVLMLLLPYFMSIGGYFYDYSELAFFFLAVLVALRYDWWWLIPIVALGEWNKESFLLIVLTLYPILRARWSRSTAVLQTSLLLVICVAIYYALRQRFAHNPGGTAQFQLASHLDFLRQPKLWLGKTEETFGLKLPRVFTVLPLAMLGWTLARGWKQLPEPIRQHGLVAAALNIPLYLLFCEPGEMRDFSLLSVVLLAVLAGNLNEWMRDTTQIAFRAQPEL
jgi:hypothetical protein